MDVTMRMPDLGTVDSTVTILRWLAEVGQLVRRGQPVLEVETDKSIMELESSVTGTLRTIAVPAGAEAATGQILASFAVENEPGVEVALASAPPNAMSVTAAKSELSPDLNPLRPGESNTISATQTQAVGGNRDSFFARNRNKRAAEPPSADLPVYSREFLLGLYQRMVLIREFEEGVKFLFLEGAMPGTIHQCQGQEATAVGVCSALAPGDFITSTFRGHGHALAKGLSQEELLFELFGASTGCCRGKGGSMHVGNVDKGMIPGIAIVAGGIPLAAGMGLAFKMQRRPHIVACFFGDGAVAEGAFHEGINLAAIWDAPVLFVCENNFYGASTRVDSVMRNPRIVDRAAAYGIKGERVDGNDVLAVYEAARSAAADCRRGFGPVLLELLTYRRTGHSRRDACHYQPKEEREDWFSRDPIDRLGGLLRERGLVEQGELDRVWVQARAGFQSAVEVARRQPLPDLDDLTTDVLVS
jgi:acetoin:2,6-dichlorophenolindophenol oxidoreductase subunit alpha